MRSISTTAPTARCSTPAPRASFSRRALLNRKPGEEVTGFTLFGPTCDTLDTMRGPFILPADIAEGDYLEIGQLGAYGRTMATRFNGFSLANRVVAVKDEPLLSLYRPQPALAEEHEVAYRAIA